MAQRLGVESAYGASFNAIHAQINALIDTIRKNCQANPSSCTPTPPEIPQLKQLQQQRDQLLEHETINLEATLGPGSTAKLHAFLQSSLANHVKTVDPKPAALKVSQQSSMAVSQ